MKKLLIIPAFFMLAACQTTDVKPDLIETKIQVIVPDPSMYRCPLPSKLPNPETLTDVQVAKAMVELYKNNKTCKNSIEAIRKYLDNAKNTLEK